MTYRIILHVRPRQDSDHRKQGPDGAPQNSRSETLVHPLAISREEQSDSDVSDTPVPSAHERFRGQPVISLGQLQPRPSADSVEVLQSHLEEIENAESINAQQKASLLAKRRRKDDRVKERRQVEDHMIEEARRRHDLCVQARRTREDEAFDRVFKELDEAESVSRTLHCRSSF
jgi:hypothetical protein